MPVLTPPEPHRDWSVEDVTVTEPDVIRRAIGAAAIGNITEWYDFGVCAYFDGAVSIWFTPEPNGRRMWGSSPAARSEEEARELVDASAG